ncbi:MAG: cob(I)yrinic acid a,c-diamide adenosyltransferase [Gammaproteobacteria bacterium]|nr:cob(I)yrinic acid a,c-diamide adenosyltransferase [Gammaproteobacteria bacterium]
MGYRLSKIYTRTGDDGNTNLGDNQRIAKDHPRLILLGTLDELNSAIGMVLALKPISASVQHIFTRLQHELFDLGGELCPPFHEVIHADHILQLEKTIDEWNATLPPLEEFILPGGTAQSANCHLARTICRRAERCAVALNHIEKIPDNVIRYLNRLSDLLFVAARVLMKEKNNKEAIWEHERT